MPKNHFKTNLFFSIMTPPTPSQNLSGHVHRLIIGNKTKKGHNLVCWYQKNYPYHTEFVSWRVDHFSFIFYFPIRGGGSAPYWNFPIFFFCFFWNLPLGSGISLTNYGHNIDLYGFTWKIWSNCRSLVKTGLKMIQPTEF